MSDIDRWTDPAAGNNSNPPNGAPDGWDRADVNEVVRELMAAVRKWYDDPEWTLAGNRNKTSGVELAVTREASDKIRIAAGDQTGYFTPLRRIKIGGIEGKVVSSDFATDPDTVVTVALDGGASVPATGTGSDETNTSTTFLYFSKTLHGQVAAETDLALVDAYSF